MTISKELFVWHNDDVSALLSSASSIGSTFQVSDEPDLMTFTDGRFVDEIPGKPGLGLPSDSNQILSGTLNGVAQNQVFNFYSSYLVTDGTNEFWMYHLSAANGYPQAYVAEEPLVQGVTYTVLEYDQSANFDDGLTVEASPFWDDFADGVVEGTAGDDVITSTSGYSDLDGEQADGNDGLGVDGNDDIIVGGTGSDTIAGGAGDDVIYGDHTPETELASNQTDFIVDGYFKDDHLQLTNDHFNSDGATEFVVNTTPTSIRFVDSDGDLDTDLSSDTIDAGETGYVEIDGELYRYAADYQQTFTGSDGNNYTFIIVDVDLNDDGVLDGISLPGSDNHFEDGQILLPVGTPPPPGVTLTSQGTGVATTLIPAGGVDYTTLAGYAPGGATYNDTISGNEGDDTLFGGQGNDLIEGGDGADAISGGDGVDWASYESSNAAVTVSLSADLPVNQTGGVEASGGHATGDTLDGIENLRGSDYDDLLEGDAEVNIIEGGAGDDMLYGGAGADTLEGGTGDDIVQGGAGNDDISGGAGVDILNGGQGDDQMSGGAGDDVFFVQSAANGHDIITDFNEGNTGSIDDNNQDNNDYVNLAGHYNQTNYDAAVAAGEIDSAVIRNPLQWMRADQADDGILNDTGAGWDATSSLTIQNSGTQVAATDLTYDNTNVICFVAGTLIGTLNGHVPIEHLAPGDSVLTRDNGMRLVRWIGSTKRAANGNVAPIHIAAGTLKNTRDLLISPNHRMLIVGAEAEYISGDNEVLVAAKHLVDGQNIRQINGGYVEYFHLLFDDHEIILAEGCWSESFHPGHVGLDTLSEPSRAEVLEFFPELRNGEHARGKPTARMILKKHEALLLRASAPQFRASNRGEVGLL